MVGFCSSNSAYARSFAGYFCKKMFDETQFKPYIPLGLDMLKNLFANSNYIKKIMDKYDLEILENFKNVVGSPGVQSLLLTQFNNHGEFMLEPLVDTLSDFTQGIQSFYRNKQNDNYFLGAREDYWLKELRDRQDRGEIEKFEDEQET